MRGVRLRSRARSASQQPSQRARRATAHWHARRRSRSKSASEQPRVDGDNRSASVQPFSACQRQAGGVRLASRQRARRVDTGASSASALPSQRARSVDSGGSSASARPFQRARRVDTGSSASGRTSRRARRVDTDSSSASARPSQHARRLRAKVLKSSRADSVIQEFHRRLARLQSANTRRRRRRTTSPMSVNHTRSSDSVSLERAASSQTSRHANSGSPQPVTGPPQSAVDHLNQFSIGTPISASAQPSPTEPTSPADEDVEDAPSAMSVDITSQRGSKWTASGITFNAAIAIGLQSSLEELVLVMRQAIVDAGLNAGLNELLDGPRICFNTTLSMRGRDVHPAITLALASGGLHNGLALPKCHDSGADQVDGWVIYHGTRTPRESCDPVGSCMLENVPKKNATDGPLPGTCSWPRSTAAAFMGSGVWLSSWPSVWSGAVARLGIMFHTIVCDMRYKPSTSWPNRIVSALKDCDHLQCSHLGKGGQWQPARLGMHNLRNSAGPWNFARSATQSHAATGGCSRGDVSAVGDHIEQVGCAWNGFGD